MNREAGLVEALMTDLLPCPFCGSAPYSELQTLDSSPRIAVWCEACGCDGPPSFDAADARAMWNHRAATASPSTGNDRARDEPSPRTEGWRPDREAVARIIDHEAYRADPLMQPTADQRQAVVQRRNYALAKADAILALAPSSTPAESQRKTASVAGLPAHVADATATDAHSHTGKED